MSVAAISVAVPLLVGGGSALAQSTGAGAEAKAQFDAGVQLMKQGKVAQACDAFEASNRAEPTAGTLLQLGNCREQNHQLGSAWAAYQEALLRVKDPRKRTRATAIAEALRPRLSYLTVAVSDDRRLEGLTLTLDGNPLAPASWNQALPIDGGDHVVAGRAPGHADWQTTAQVAVERASVRVEVPGLAEVPRLEVPTPVAASQPPPAQPPEPAPEPSPVTPPARGAAVVGAPDREAARHTPIFTTRRKVALGVVSVSVISAAGGWIAGASAQGKQNDAFVLCSPSTTICTRAEQSNALLRSARSRALVANAAWGVAAAGAIGAALLWFTGASSAEAPRRISVVPSAAPGETSIVVMGRF